MLARELARATGGVGGMITAATTDTISMSNPVLATTTSTSLSNQVLVPWLIVQVCNHCGLLVITLSEIGNARESYSLLPSLSSHSLKHLSTIVLGFIMLLHVRKNENLYDSTFKKLSFILLILSVFFFFFTVFKQLL